MADHDLDVLIDQWWGGGYDSSALNSYVASASGIAFGGNPAYKVSDFFSMYPKFDDNDKLPVVVIQSYINLALKCIQKVQWGDEWVIAMGWFVAHYCTMWLRSEGNPGTTAMRVASSGLEAGIKTSKSVGGVSVGYSQIDNLAEWGAFRETTYGVQLATRAQALVVALMYVW